MTPSPASNVPHIAGQRQAYLVKQLKSFRSDDRRDDVMNAVAKQLSDADIAHLATYWSSQPAGSDLVVPAAVAPIRGSRMQFPNDFPQGYARYNTAFNADDKTVGRSYANSVAIEAARENRPLPDGSVILVAVYKARLDSNGEPIRDPNGDYAIGDLVNYSGMEARAGWGGDIPNLLRNGTWNYGIFEADKTLRTQINQAFCLACHKPASANGYVFTLTKLQQADYRQ